MTKAIKPAISERHAEQLAGVWLTPKDLAQQLQMNERTVVRYLEQGKLPGRKIGTKWRTHRSQMEALANGTLCDVSTDGGR